MSLTVVYDIANEPDRRFSNVLTDPPFRSPEWWSALGTSAMPLHVHSGVISSVFWSGFGDWPEFTLRTTDGQFHNWTRDGDVSRYVEGLAAEVSFVTVHYKRKIPSSSPSMDTEGPVVVRILVEHSDLRSDPVPWSARRRRPPTDTDNVSPSE